MALKWCLKGKYRKAWEWGYGEVFHVGTLIGRSKGIGKIKVRHAVEICCVGNCIRKRGVQSSPISPIWILFHLKAGTTKLSEI